MKHGRLRIRQVVRKEFRKAVPQSRSQHTARISRDGVLPKGFGKGAGKGFVIGFTKGDTKVFTKGLTKGATIRYLNKTHIYIYIQQRYL